MHTKTSLIHRQGSLESKHDHVHPHNQLDDHNKSCIYQ